MACILGVFGFYRTSRHALIDHYYVGERGHTGTGRFLLQGIFIYLFGPLAL
jgi:hypothetical protein